MHFKERHIEIVRALQKAEDVTSDDLAQCLGLQTRQVMNALKPLIACGVVKDEEDDGKTLYYLTPNADELMMETYGESIAEIFAEMLDMDPEINRDGIMFLFSIATNEIDIVEAPDDEDDSE